MDCRYVAHCDVFLELLRERKIATDTVRILSLTQQHGPSEAAAVDQKLLHLRLNAFHTVRWTHLC
jgi:hypothetical protein